MDVNSITEQFIKSVTENFLSTLTTQLRNQIAVDVSREVNNFDVRSAIQTQISDLVNKAIAGYHEGSITAQNAIVDSTVEQFKVSTDQFLDRLVTQIQTNVINKINDKINGIDVDTIAKQQVFSAVEHYVKSMSFPELSISGSSVRPDNLRVYGNNILPGIIKNFESTGIQDGATQCQVTILDNATVFENRLVAKELNIVGDVKFDGNVIFAGPIADDSPFLSKIVQRTRSQIEQQFDLGTFDLFTDRALNKINSEGLSSEIIKVDGEKLVTDNSLSTKITKSNLQKVGPLTELQVIGETLLDETVYVSNKRLGVNTLEPEKTVDIWDQEIQLVAGKRSKDVAMIGTIRPQNLVLSSNNKDNLTLNVDGTVSIPQLLIGRTKHTSSISQPTDNRPAGQIVWNEQPIIGGPIGWVSLGGARWARFGTVSE